MKPYVFIVGSLLGAVLVGGVAAALSDVGLPRPLPLKASEEAWTVADSARFDPDDALSEISKGRLWVDSVAMPGLPPVAEPPLTPPDWRISGVYLVEGQKFALLRQDGQPDLPLKVGDLLPGKFKILDITADWIVIQIHGKRRAISTYRE